MTRKFLLFLSIFLGGLFFGAFSAWAQSPYCGNGICEIEDYVYCSPPSDCYVGSSCSTPNCPGNKPEDICCLPNADCPEGWDTWDYAYDAQCKVTRVDDLGFECSWEWQYRDCSAADRCEGSSNVAYACDGDPSGSNDTGKILAGWCSTSCVTGCANGGWYKTCCQVSGVVQSGAQLTGNRTSCTNGGGCSSGARVWGTSCDGCLGSVDAYGTWTVGPCGGVPTTAPTSAPGDPTPTTGSCAVGAQWCTNPDQCAASGCTVADTPYGACAIEGDICCSCPSSQEEAARIKVNIVGTEHEVGEPVTIQVYQEPANTDTPNDDCYYASIEVKVNNPGGIVLPPDYVVCEAGGFKDESVDNGCSWGGDEGRCRTCIWNTNNVQAAPDDRAYELPVRQYPAGPYTAGVYYGGHSDPVCKDESADASDDTTLWGESEIYFTASQTCSYGGECVPLDLTSGDYIDYGIWTDNEWVSNFDWGGFLRVWRTEYGDPKSTGSSWTCYLRGSDSCPDGCAGIEGYNASNFLGTSNDDNDDYSVSLDIQNLDSDREYLVSVYGYGVNAHAPGFDCESQTRPFMKLESGSLSTVDYMIVDKECDWQEKTMRIVPQDGTITATLTSKGTKHGCGGYLQQSAFENFSICECPEPISPPTAPSLSQPPDGAQIRIDDVSLVWTHDGAWGVNSAGNNNSFEVFVNEVPSGTPEFSALGSYQTVDENTSSVGLDVSYDTRYCWGVRADNGALTADSEVWCFETLSPVGWFQGQSGNVYGHNGVSSLVSSSVSDWARYFSLDSGDFGSSAIIASPQGTAKEFGDALAATKSNPDNDDWLVEADLSRLADRYTYNYFASLLDLNQANEEIVWVEGGEGDAVVNAINGNPSKEVFVYQEPGGDGTLLFTDSADFSGRKVIVLFDGDVEVSLEDGEQLAPADFFALIASGSINFTGNTGDTSGVYIGTASALGVFVAGDQITTSVSSSRFIGRGIFFARNGFSLGRDLGSNNETLSAEFFRFDPKYFFTAPKVFRYSPQIWQELAP
ncbi:MAG: hypothetical protein ACOYJ8_00335 [Patescibacteria group bacterium]|jgi:hypothetical protein